jgi:hydroxymethylpyrimidine pyrophosphatase-like HAD family hydrolase
MKALDPKPKFPPVKCIFIDVDGTLDIDGKLNVRLAKFAKEQKEKGYEVNLWSAQGKSHAQKIAEKHGVTDCFDAIISKPGYIVDDLKWDWTKYTKTIKGFTK